MKNERYGNIYAEINEINRLRKEYDYRFVNLFLIISTIVHAAVFYGISLISLNALIVSALAYLCSLVIVYAVRQDEFAKRHELHAVTIQDEVIRLQELVQDNLIDSEDAKELTPSVYS